MMIKVKFLIMTLAVFLFQICGIGFAESEIPLTLKYEFPVFNKRVYSSHSTTYAHSTHVMEYKIACVRCHHTLEPGATAVEETCMDCHGRKALGNDQRFRRISKEEKVRTYLMGLHDMCIECHQEIKANNLHSKVPLACWQCHIRK